MLDRSYAVQSLLAKYKGVSKDKPLHVILDPGNTDVKIMVHDQWGHERYIPHIIQPFNAEQYENAETRYKDKMDRMSQSAVFRMEKIGNETVNKGFIVGIHASDQAKRITGAKKYTRDHMSPLFMAAMLQVYPVSHLNVHVLVLHPANITGAQKENLLNSLKGTHSAQLPNGDTITYKVRGIVTVEEVVAGFQSFFFNYDGKPDKGLENAFRINDRALVIDIGGRFSSFLPIVRTQAGLEVILNRQGTFEIGIQHVQEALNEELKHSFPSLADQDWVPSYMLDEALKYGSIRISGNAPQPCSNEVDRAIAPLATKISNEYRDRYNGGVGFQAIIISGGGGGLAYNYLSDRVLNHRQIEPAEKHEDLMRYANIRGAGKVYKLFLLQQQKVKRNG